MSKSFEPVAEKLPVEIILPVHDILTKVPVPLQVKVGPDIIPELATLLAVNTPALMVPAVITPVQPRVPELRMLVVESVLRLIVIQGTVEMMFEYTKNLITLVFVSTSIIPFLLKVPPGVENPSWALEVELPATIPRFVLAGVVGFMPA